VLFLPVGIGTGSGTVYGYYFDDTTRFGTTNYLGVSGGIGKVGNGWDTWAGSMLSQGGLTLGQISAADGTANTLMFGEVASNMSATTIQRGYAWMGAGFLPTAYGMPDVNLQNSQWYQFNSRHTAIVHFAMGDGSIRPIRKGVVTLQFRHASGVADGNVYNLD
jgi:hypothetical protein